MREQGASTDRAEEIAARTVNKERARSGESRTRSRTSTRDISSSRRGGLRSGTNRPKGRTKEQLYNEAKNLGIEGRSKMNKAQLQRAIDRRRSRNAREGYPAGGDPPPAGVPLAPLAPAGQPGLPRLCRGGLSARVPAAFEGVRASAR